MGYFALSVSVLVFVKLSPALTVPQVELLHFGIDEELFVAAELLLFFGNSSQFGVPT